MPPSADLERPAHDMTVTLMAVQTEHFKSQVKWEPWKAMAIAAGAGAALMGATIGLLTLLIRSLRH